MAVNYPQHIGKVAFFSTKEAYEQFIDRVADAIKGRRKEYEANKMLKAWRGRVTIEVLDDRWTARFAADMETVARPGYAAYLNPNAGLLCAEARIECPISDQPNKAKPDYVSVAIDDDYWFSSPRASSR